MAKSFDAHILKKKFGEQFETNVSLARFTSARIGGLADGLLTINSIEEMVDAVTYLWHEEMPFIILGGGSNVLVSDAGVRGLVVLNKARQVIFDQKSEPPTVSAASGSNFGQVARMAAQRGLSGLEWAAGIPGTIGGAVIGNAGAHGGDIAGNLVLAEILHREFVDNRSENGNAPDILVKREQWGQEKFLFSYRSSIIKEMQAEEKRTGDEEPMGWSEINQPSIVILGAILRLAHSKQEDVESLMKEYGEYRRKTQPVGASMGSMFKNPPGEYAGKLIEQAGLKGIRVGDAAISPLHGNFFINYGNASAADVWDLISLAQNIVAKKFEIDLELEIELIGSWQVVRK